MDFTKVSILAVDRAFTPDKWLDGPTALSLFSRGIVQSTFGDQAMRLRGGTNAITGKQSFIDICSIIVVDTKNHLVKDFDYAPYERGILFKRDQCICAYCGEQYKVHQLEVEHVRPLCQGGTTTFSNLVTSCSWCNRKKAGRTPEQAGMPLLYLPYQPSRFEWLILKNRHILSDQNEFLRARLPKHSRLL